MDYVRLAGNLWVMQHTIGIDEYLINIPGITQLPSALPDSTIIPLPEFIIPISDNFVTDGNAYCCQQFFDVTEAKCKPVIKPFNSSGLSNLTVQLRVVGLLIDVERK